MTAGLTLTECAIKELSEEAGLESDRAKFLKVIKKSNSLVLIKKKFNSIIKPVDAITYAYEEENDEGVCIEGEFVFDIKLPEDFVPKNTDGEVGEFYLMNIEQVFKIQTKLKNLFKIFFKTTFNFQVKKAIISPEFKPNSAAITLGIISNF